MALPDIDLQGAEDDAGHPAMVPSHRAMDPNRGARRCSFPKVEVSMDAIGRRRWAIAEGYIPSESSFSNRELISHETACILNAGDRDAHIAITIFFVDREPMAYQVTVPARRTLHL